ncbi:uncharacterized protein DC041_0010352 [Schistosoma bovis]|uniref:Thioredoxin domain-containing protein n=1 Tax=Schistosoma bovis TaxID=6184 RepID=A0A430QR32_SCHBO|nr:uncharacterized protein DC041_0010352 [Schistosoma bovis]
MLVTVFILNILLRTVHSFAYSEIEGVTVLHPENFDKTSEGIWLVIFYRKTCGHCIKYSKPFSQFCRSVKSNSIFILLIFLSTKNSKQTSEEIPAEWNVTLLRKSIASKLVNVSALQLPRDLAVNDPIIVTGSDIEVNALLLLDYSLLLKREIQSVVKPGLKEIDVTNRLSGEVIVK